MDFPFQTFYTGALLATPAFYLTQAVVIYGSGRRSGHHAAWIAFCLTVSVAWLMIALTTRVIESTTIALVTAKLGLTFAAASTCSNLLFGVSFVGTLGQRRTVVGISVLGTATCVLLFWATPLMVESVERYGYGLNQPVAGPLMPLYGLLVLFNLLVPVLLFVKAYRRESGRRRLQLGYILLAVTVILVAGAGSLGSFTQKDSLIALIPLMSMCLAPALITYAIIRHQLWDIRTVAHKTALWAVISALTLTPVYLLLRSWPALFGQNTNAQLLLTMCLFGAFALHFRVIQPRLDQVFSRRRHDHLKVVDKFTHEVLNLRGMRALGQLLCETVQRTLYCRDIVVASIDVESGAVQDLTNGDSPLPALPELLRAWLAKRDIAIDVATLEAYELEPDLLSELKAVADRGVSVLLPLVHESQLVGLAELGEKTTLRPYTRGDFEILERIRAPATVALANAQLYDRLGRLTQSLEYRVQQRTKELETANEQLREADRAKSKFFANITHELRTPLTLILAPLEDMLLDNAVSGAGDLEAMHRNGMRLLRQINALLDLAKTDAGALRLRVEQIPLEEFVEAAVHNFGPIARRKGIRLGVEGTENSVLIPGDSEKLDLVLGNLLANAIKFTSEGGEVMVSMGCDEHSAWVSVRDTGIGIPQDQIARIFDRFAQVDAGNTRRFEGAGIGLALVKEIIELHGGEIEVRSVEDEGSEFRVTLRRESEAITDSVRDRRLVDVPLARPRRAEDRDLVAWVPIAMTGDAYITVHGSKGTDTPSSGSSRSVDGTARRVLLVEDNADMQRYLVRRLGGKYQLEICHDGRAALELIRERPPDLVLSDVMMPEMSGYELCQAIKEDAALATVPVILVTARKGVDRALEGFQSGADDYLTKPFNYQELEARIQVQLKLTDAMRRLAEQEKRNVLSVVAAGLAHEVRNPINAILNAARPLQELATAPADSPMTPEDRLELLSVVVEAATRVDTLVGDLLGVARDNPEEVAPWQIKPSVESAERLLRYKHGKRVQLECSMAHTSAVVGNTAQLNQVLMNLLDNAMRAAGEDGHVWVGTTEADGAVTLQVRDNGKGIAAAVVDRIFDPLFSTHDSPDATGLGLHITKRIVEQHGGTISAKSHCETGGAEFTVVFPIQPEGTAESWN